MRHETTNEQEDGTERMDAMRRLLTSSLFPDDAIAVIYKPARSAMTSGTAGTRRWKLRFERRSAPFVEPLMGWTGSDDTLAQVKLSFPSAEAAIAYARHQGLQFIVQGADSPGRQGRRVSDLATGEDSYASLGASRRRFEWMERMFSPDLIRHGSDPGRGPASLYRIPEEVLQDITLSPEQKQVLHRWAFAYLPKKALPKDQLPAANSRLDEVIDAHLDLDKTQTGASVGRPSPPARDKKNRVA